MKYEKVHKIYEKGLEGEELDPTLVSEIYNIAVNNYTELVIFKTF